MASSSISDSNRPSAAANSLAKMRLIVRNALISWRHQHLRAGAVPILRASAEARGADCVSAREELAVEGLIARDLPNVGYLMDAECAALPAGGGGTHAPPRAGAASSEAS